MPFAVDYRFLISALVLAGCFLIFILENLFPVTNSVKKSNKVIKGKKSIAGSHAALC